MGTLQEISKDLLYEIVSRLNQPLVQPEQDREEQARRENPPAQPCGAEFKTRGRFRATSSTPPDLGQAIVAILSAYMDALNKARRFCELLGEDGCKTVEFVRYDFFDSDVRPVADKHEVTVELIVVWKCIRS